MNWKVSSNDINDTAIEILDILRSQITSGNTYNVSLTLTKVENNSMEYYQGDIVRVDFGEGVGYENSGVCDAVIVQNNNGNKFSKTLIVVPIIKNAKGRIATDVECYGYVFKTNKISVIDKNRIVRKVSSLNLNISQVFEGILSNLGIIGFNHFNPNNAKLDYSRGDVVYVDLGETTGSEQSGIRPCLILQNDVGNYYGDTTVVVPLTEKEKKELPTHYTYPRKLIGGNDVSTLLFEQIKMIDKSRILGKVDTIEINKIAEVEDILRNILFR